MNIDEKLVCIDKLSFCYNRIYYLRVLCDEQGRAGDALRLERRRTRLKLELDELLVSLYQDWMGEAEALQDKLISSNEVINRSIKDIQSQIQTAQNTTKVIGYLDDVINLAANLIP